MSELNGSWGGVSFTVLAEGYGRGQAVDITTIRYPWGDNSTTFVGGKGPETPRYTLLFESEADYETLFAKQGDTGTLVAPTANGTALLVKLGDAPVIYPDGKVQVPSEWLMVTG